MRVFRAILVAALTLMITTLLSTPVFSAGRGAVLTVWDITEAQSYDVWWSKFVAEFEKENPGVTVNKTAYEVVPYDDKLLAAMAAGNEPDIFYNISGESIAKFVRAGKVAKLDGLIDVSRFNNALLGALKYDGNLYAIPIYPYIFVMWYNATIFQRLQLHEPQTWTDFINACDTIKKAGLIPIALGNQSRWPMMTYFDLFAFEYGGPGIREKASFGIEGITWQNAAFVRAGQRIIDLIDRGFLPEGFNGFDHARQNALFFNGQTAMDFMGDWLIPTAKTDAPKDFKMGAFNLPPVSDAKFGAKGQEVVSGGINIFSVSESSKNKEVAAKFLNRFGQQTRDFVRATGVLPVSPDAKPPANELEAKVAEILNGAAYNIGNGDRILPAAIVDDYLNGIQQLSLKQITPEGFASQMAKATSEKKSEFK
jgi:raffinose/stachyose/melibiose transport system substrate-binding protein